MRIMFNYIAEEEGQLNVAEGDVVEVLLVTQEEKKEGWLKVFYA
jgi:hypothetical protein